MANPLIELLKNKERVRDRLESLLNENEKEAALKDRHSYRKPLLCGMTVHTGIGCPLKCLYCYIGDMGFPWTIKPYPLNPLQLVYALASNPYFIPGDRGTFIALGSVTEPFLEIVKEKTIGYIEAIAKYLGNPIQFSTKMYLSKEDVIRLKEADQGISPLVTIVTLKHYKRLEPYAPNPLRRMETIENLSKAGLKPILFYRPVIPGINDREYRELLSLAREYGAKGVVVGGFRVTENILSRLEKAGFNTTYVIERLSSKPKGRRQVSVNIGDLKKRIMEYALSIGLTPFPLACMANLYTHGWRCVLMEEIGVHNGRKYSKPEYNHIVEASEYLGVEVFKTRFYGNKLVIYGRGDYSKLFLLSEVVKYYYRVCTKAKMV